MIDSARPAYLHELQATEEPADGPGPAARGSATWALPLRNRRDEVAIQPSDFSVRPEGIEPPTYRFEVCRSIQLSYGRVGGGLSAIWALRPARPPTFHTRSGLLLRRTVWDRGTAVAFVIVATAFLGVVIVGWRVAFDRLRASRSGA